MLMNMFDIFDLDDDGLLSRREFEAYSILSGSGPVSEQVINAQQLEHIPFLFLIYFSLDGA
jgi:Ca2+-binding EF-hand superfamily protein